MKTILEGIELSKKEEKDISTKLKTWHTFVASITDMSEDYLLKAMSYEISQACRINIIDRLRTRYNKVRALRELRELEESLGLVISITMVGKK